MGYFTWFFSIFEYFGLDFFTKKANILLIGLDNAGKTTLLNILSFDRFAQYAPTYYPHKEEFTVNGVKFNAFDCGGHKSAQQLWSSYSVNCSGIVFIVDTADSERIEESKLALMEFLSIPEIPSDLPVLILGNKIDRGTMSEDELRSIFGLRTTGKEFRKLEVGVRPIELFMCSVIKRIGFGDGNYYFLNCNNMKLINEYDYDIGFKWLSFYIKNI